MLIGLSLSQFMCTKINLLTPQIYEWVLLSSRNSEKCQIKLKICPSKSTFWCVATTVNSLNSQSVMQTPFPKKVRHLNSTKSNPSFPGKFEHLTVTLFLLTVLFVAHLAVVFHRKLSYAWGKISSIFQDIYFSISAV